MKFKMAKNSLFAILLRSSWWISLALAVALGLAGAVLLPVEYRIAGALSGFPFAVISAMAAWRQWKLPSAARIDETRDAVSQMAWPAFSALLEQAFSTLMMGKPLMPSLPSTCCPSSMPPKTDEA